LTKVRLAELVGVSVRAVTDFETGAYPPGDETLERLADELRFPLTFFMRPDVEVLPSRGVSFRSLAAMKAGQRESALAAGEIALEIDAWIGERFDLPAVDLPDLHDFKPEAAAVALRAQWGLGERPIKSIVHTLEARGVRVFSLSERNKEVDAYSFWRGGVPYCFLNGMKSAEHSRMDAAHELGHLVMHRHGHPSGKEAESQANEFAAAFLMPQHAVLVSAPKMATLQGCIEHKQEFGASLAAYVRRLHTVGRLSDWHYRTLCIELAKAGYRRSEPAGAPHETSQVLNKVLRALRAEGLGKTDIAKDLDIYVADLDALIFGLVITAVDGGRVGDRPGPPGKAPLRAV
jgi:Zn-dependent peptidase ImmA (M78 family)